MRHRRPGLSPERLHPDLLQREGAAGEQIDTLSGNLNFTLPLVKAMGRNGWSANFGLSYNSQLWRHALAATWKLGRDVGYGFGWRFQAGSLTPYWQNPWTIHHYLFVDSTGAGQGMTLVTNTYDGMSGYLEPPGPPPAPRCTGRSTYSISPLIYTATTNGHWTRTTMDGMGRTVHVTRPGYSGALLPLDPAGR